MKLTLPKDFCLWVVPSNDGKVHKVRFTVWRALAVVGFVGCFLALFVLISGDYARVQLLRVRHALTLKSLTAERNELLAREDQLSREIRALLDKNKSVLTYEQSIRGRMDELTSILESAAEMGLLPEEKLSGKGATNGGEAVGGLETDCKSKDCFQESAITGDPRHESDTLTRVHQQSSNLSTKEFISRLDTLVSIMKTIPLRLPTSGHVTSMYGVRKSPFSGRSKMHHGMDFSTPYGSNIYVTGDGVVKAVKRSSTYGLSVDVDHGNNVVTRYAHLSRAFVKAGAKVQSGQIVALAGSSGRSTGPHLHYEIRVNKNSVDPSRVLRLAPRIQNILRSSGDFA